MLLINLQIVTVDDDDRVIPQGFIRIEGSRIAELGPMTAAPDPYDGPVLDLSGMFAFPGFVNTHTHSFQALTRGIGEGLPVWDWFSQALDMVVGHLTAQDARLAAQVTALESIRSGATCVMDYNYPHPHPRMADAAIEGFLDIGVRTVLGRGIIDAGDVHATIVHDGADELADCRRLLRAWHASHDDLIRIWLAPYTVFSTSTHTFQAAASMAREHDTGLSIHAATPSTLEAARSLFGSTDVQYEERIGVLSPNMLLVHCTHPSPQDLDIMARHGVTVSHNPASNAYLGEGCAPIIDMGRRGITVGLGTDGAASNNNQDMLAVLKLTALLQKMQHEDPSVLDARTTLRLATMGGATCLGWADQIGSLEVGKRADIIIVDPWLPNTVAFDDPSVSLVYSATQENIRTVLVNGQLVMHDRRVLTVDEGAILRAAQTAAVDLRQRSGLRAAYDPPHDS